MTKESMNRGNRIFFWVMAAWVLTAWGFFVAIGLKLLDTSRQGFYFNMYFMLMLFLSSLICMTDIIGAVNNVTVIEK